MTGEDLNWTMWIKLFHKGKESYSGKCPVLERMTRKDSTERYLIMLIEPPKDNHCMEKSNTSKTHLKRQFKYAIIDTIILNLFCVN